VTYLALLIAALSGALAMHAVHSYFEQINDYRWNMVLAGHGLAMSVFLVAMA
jgi:hypothetical protein